MPSDDDPRSKSVGKRKRSHARHLNEVMDQYSFDWDARLTDRVRGEGRHPRGYGKLLSQVSMDELVRLYHQDGLSLGDIAQQFGVTRQGVHNLFKAHDIQTRDRSQARILALAQEKVKGKPLRRKVVGFAKVPPKLCRTSGVTTVALKRTSMQFDPQDMTALARMARQETTATGIRVTAAGIVRRMIKEYLRAQDTKGAR